MDQNYYVMRWSKPWSRMRVSGAQRGARSRRKKDQHLPPFAGGGARPCGEEPADAGIDSRSIFYFSIDPKADANSRTECVGGNSRLVPILLQKSEARRSRRGRFGSLAPMRRIG